jgi:hypothetical protein
MTHYIALVSRFPFFMMKIKLGFKAQIYQNNSYFDSYGDLFGSLVSKVVPTNVQRL